MSDNQHSETTLQADGRGGQVQEDGAGTTNRYGRDDGGESPGGAYSTSIAHRASHLQGSFLGHGMQSEITYHAPASWERSTSKGKKMIIPQRGGTAVAPHLMRRKAFIIWIGR